MEWFVRAFIKASLAWLGLGVTLGVAMAAHPAWVIYRPAHVHMNLHWALANLGLATMVAGFGLQPRLGTRAIPILAAGGTLSALGA